MADLLIAWRLAHFTATMISTIREQLSDAQNLGEDGFWSAMHSGAGGQGAGKGLNSVGEARLLRVHIS
jgi:hypothetical protein